MKTPTNKPIKPAITSKTTSHPVRLTKAQEAQLKELKKRTGHFQATIRRAAMAYSLPRFISGEADLISEIAALSSSEK